MAGLLRSLPRAYIDHIALCLENKEEEANIQSTWKIFPVQKSHPFSIACGPWH
jgi:hypothetical protein